MADIKIIVGLGNPGSEYADTRHNAGFWVVDSLAKMLGADVKQKKFGALFGQYEYKGKKLIFIKPQDYMNRSGQAVATAVGFYKVPLEDILVISDDMALEAGRIRIRPGGSAGGQKGLADVIGKLGTDKFSRLRVGIGASGIIPGHSYVLARPSKEQIPLLEDAVERAGQAVLCWVEDGVEKAMCRFNDRQKNVSNDCDV